MIAFDDEHLRDRFHEWLEEQLRIDDLESMLLKGRIVVVDLVRAFVGCKLGIDPLRFSFGTPLTSSTLVELARAGEEVELDVLARAVRNLDIAADMVARWVPAAETLEFAVRRVTIVASVLKRRAGIEGFFDDEPEWPPGRLEQVQYLRTAIRVIVEALLDLIVVRHANVRGIRLS